MPYNAIEVSNLGKKYIIHHHGQERCFTLRDVMAQTAKNISCRIIHPFSKNPEKNKKEDFWALKDVSFALEHGDAIGVIGRNGAGKSTLLKLLSRITEPTTGKIKIRGRVASLLEVGTGFHPELTGRENIFLNGAILGMTKREIVRKFDEIVDFSEIERFLDTPVKRYSSGMYIRLAFAVAAHLEPEILLVDEVLAIGDIAFQKKCLGKMGEVSEAGRTVVFVNHNMAAIENLCSKCILLEDGQVVTYDTSHAVIDHYVKTVLPSIVEETPLAERMDRSGSGRIKLTGFHIEDENRNRLSCARSGMNVVFVFKFQCHGDNPPKNVDIGLSIRSSTNQILFVLYGSYMGQTFESIPQQGDFRCVIPNFPLSEGRYQVGARITANNEEADWPKNGVGYIDIEAGDFYGSGNKGFSGKTHFLVSGKWTVD